MNLELKEITHQTVKKVIGTQVSEKVYLKLKAEAENSFMSISDLLRKIIFNYYKDELKGEQK